MKGLAVSNIAWDPSEDEEIAAVLRAEGCAGVEVAPTKRWPDPGAASAAEAAEYRAWWESRGIRIVALQALLFGRPELQLFGSAESRAAMLEYLEKIVVLGGRLGARALVFGSPKNRLRGGLASEQAEEIAAAFLTELGRRAEDAGVVVCLEANPPAYGGDFVTTTAEAVSLCRRVGSRGIAVNGDLGGITLAGEAVAPAVAEAAPYLAHFHISEPELRETATAGADHRAAAGALVEAGYEGWASIEMRAPVGEPAAAVVRRAIRAARGFYLSDPGSR